MTWGDGPLTIALIHGYSDDAATWWKVGPALAARGCTVIAPDLRGHGLSPRGDRYSLEDFADDLVETLPEGLDVLVGHSLGGLVVGYAVDRLRPGHAVYVDPPWGPRPQPAPGRDPAAETMSSVAARKPRWDRHDVRVDVISSRMLDRGVTEWLLTQRHIVHPPPCPVVPATVVVPSEESLLSDATQASLAGLGFELVGLPGAGHVVHRDNLDDFVALLEARIVVNRTAP